VTVTTGELFATGFFLAALAVSARFRPTGTEESCDEPLAAGEIAAAALLAATLRFFTLRAIASIT